MTVLIGEQASGLNASGEKERQGFQDTIENLQSDIDEFQIKVENNVVEQNNLLNLMDQRIYIHEKEQARMWIDLNNFSDKIDAWENNNSYFRECQKEFVGYSLMNEYYAPEERDTGSVLIMRFKSGDLVYNRNKGILCYGPEHDGFNPEPIDCQELCTDEN